MPDCSTISEMKYFFLLFMYYIAVAHVTVHVILNHFMNCELAEKFWLPLL